MATITLTISEYVDSKTNLTHFDIKQVAAGGISGTTENRTLDWTYRDHKDGIFGSVKGKSRWVALKDVDDDDFLKTGWESADGDFVQAYVESNDNGWTANQVSCCSPCYGGAKVGAELIGVVIQIWGFETVNEERRHTRHVVVRKGDDWKLARLVYDYHG